MLFHPLMSSFIAYFLFVERSFLLFCQNGILTDFTIKSVFFKATALTENATKAL